MGDTTMSVWPVAVLLLSTFYADSSAEQVTNSGGDKGACGCIQMQSLLAMMQQQSATVQMLQSSLQGLQAQITGMSTDVRQQSNGLQNLSAVLSDVNNRVSDVNANFTLQMQFVRNRMDSQALPGKVAFSAHMTTPYGVNVGNDSPFVFGVVVTNIGDAYNRHTGIFTAPYDGVYVFHFVTINNGNAPTIHPAIVKNGEVLVVGTSDGIGNYNNYDDASALVTIRLAVGDRVYVRRRDGGTQVYGGEYCNFSGFLLGPAV